MKKTLLILLALLMIASSVVVLPVSAIGGDAWNGNVTEAWYNANATTLVINNASDLAAFVVAVNNGNDFSGKTVALAADIIWNNGDAKKWSATVSPANKWTPIGNDSSAFCGVFDGNGYTVSGLYTYSTGNNVGFFGCVKNATVKNLNIDNSYFNACMIAGAVVGRATGDFTMSNCSANADIVSNYSVKASDSYYAIGGLAGYIGEDTSVVKIEKCAFTGSVLSELLLGVGGIAGYVRGSITIDACIAEADIAGYNRMGGIVGRTYGNTTISRCYSNCDIFVWTTKNYGHILGSLRTKNKTVTITDCYYTGKAYLKGSTSNYTVVADKTDLPTRLGCYEIDTDNVTALGNIALSSTYYSDSSNDNSYTSSANQAGLSMNIINKGGFSTWFEQQSIKEVFTKDIYGNLRLKQILTSESCPHSFGRWVNDASTGMQTHQCMVNGCTYSETRDQSISILGAAVRIAAPTGIRFLTKVDKNEFFKNTYNGDYNNYRINGANITFGTLIMPLDMVEGELTVDTANVLNIKAEKLYDQNEKEIYFTGVLTDYPERTDTFNREMAVRSYMKYDGKYIYSDMVSTSFYDVATRAYEKEGQGAKQGLNLLLALGSVSDDFYAENPQRVLKLEYATPELFASYAAALEKEGYTKHLNYEYSDNYFGLYSNDEYTVTFYYTPKTIGKYTDTDQSKWYAAGNYHDDWTTINKYVSIEDADNIMRVIVEKTSEVDLPAAQSENNYSKLAGQKNTLAFFHPNDSDNKPGMGYVFQLADGSFIIIDGGDNSLETRGSADKTKYDSDYIYDYLVKHAPGGKPVIAAWILTHQHGDHVNVIKGMLSNPTYAKNITLEQVIYNFMEHEVYNEFATKERDDFAEQNIKPYFPDTKIITAHTGYKFYIRNAQVNVLYSIDDFYPNKVSTFSNNETMVFDLIIDGVQRFMFTGDMFVPASRALVNMYGTDLKSDVIQIAHHGNFGATEEVNKLIWPDEQDYTSNLRFALLPNPKAGQSAGRLNNPENTWLEKVVKNDGMSWSYSASTTDKLYANFEIMYNKTIMGSNVLTSTSSEKSYSWRANGKYQVLEIYTAN